MLVVGSKSNLGCEAGCGLTFSWSDHGRIMFGSAPHWKWRFIRLRTFFLTCCSVIFRGRRSIWWGWMVTFVTPRIVNDVSYVTRIKHRSHFRGSIWWGWMVTPVAPRIVNDVSYVMTIKHSSRSVWQAQYLVRFKCHFSWLAQYLVRFKCHFSWQAQYLVKFKCHFSWQAQYLVKVGM